MDLVALAQLTLKRVFKYIARLITLTEINYSINHFKKRFSNNFHSLGPDI